MVHLDSTLGVGADSADTGVSTRRCQTAAAAPTPSLYLGDDGSALDGLYAELRRLDAEPYDADDGWAVLDRVERSKPILEQINVMEHAKRNRGAQARTTSYDRLYDGFAPPDDVPALDENREGGADGYVGSHHTCPNCRSRQFKAYKAGGFYCFNCHYKPERRSQRIPAPDGLVCVPLSVYGYVLAAKSLPTKIDAVAQLAYAVALDEGRSKGVRLAAHGFVDEKLGINPKTAWGRIKGAEELGVLHRSDTGASYGEDGGGKRCTRVDLVATQNEIRRAFNAKRADERAAEERKTATDSNDDAKVTSLDSRSRTASVVIRSEPKQALLSGISSSVTQKRAEMLPSMDNKRPATLIDEGGDYLQVACIVCGNRLYGFKLHRCMEINDG